MSRLPKKKKTAKKQTAARRKSAPAKKKSSKKKKLIDYSKFTEKELRAMGLFMAKRPGAGRYFITTKDIQIITKKSERSAQRILQTIRKKAGKPRHSPVTMQEFCKHMAMTEQLAKEILGD